MLLLLATEVGSGYLLRWSLIAGGEATVGARVEVGPVKASLLDTRVLVRERGGSQSAVADEEPV